VVSFVGLGLGDAISVIALACNYRNRTPSPSRLTGSRRSRGPAFAEIDPAYLGGGRRLTADLAGSGSEGLPLTSPGGNQAKIDMGSRGNVGIGLRFPGAGAGPS
jgi:hypothetical protein